MNNIHGIDTLQNKERVKITCVERKYRVEKPNLSFIITAKTELDEDSTSRLLQEDMELKTFLANYDIVDIVCPSKEIIEEHIVLTNPATDSITKIKNIKIGDTDIENIKPEDVKTENIKEDDIKTENTISMKKLSHKKKYKQVDVPRNTEERRELFSHLDLPEVFTTRNYIEAFEKKGINITNSAMPYDDLYYLEKLGKVTRLGKKAHGTIVWKKIKKDVVKRETPIFI